LTHFATRCRFVDGGTFTRTFQVATGKTPSEYRKQLRIA